MALTFKKKPYRKKCGLLRKISAVFTFPHIWVCIAIAALSVVALVLSWRLKCSQPFWSSIFANVFAGLITGLVVCFIGGVKQIHMVHMQSKLAWLKDTADLIKLYLNDHHKMQCMHFDKFNGEQETFDFYYNMSIRASNINMAIQQGSFNKTLSFNPDRYCRKSFQYDSVAMGAKFDHLHEFVEMIEVDCPSSKTIAKEFDAVHPELRKLNSAVHSTIRELEIRLSDIKKTIL